MLEGRLLAMTILFFAAIATMVPLAFFAGLERGRSSLSAQAAELPQKETVFELGLSARKPYSGSVTICDSGDPLSQSFARIVCGAATPVATPQTIPDVAVRPQSQALSRSVVAAIADSGDPTQATPLGLAMALEGGAPAGQRADRMAFGGTGFPGSLTPIALTSPGGSATPPHPSDPSDPTAPPPAVEPPLEPPVDPPMMEPPMTEPPDLIVPLPAAVLLFSSGLAFIFALARRRKRPSGAQ